VGAFPAAGAGIAGGSSVGASVAAGGAQRRAVDHVLLAIASSEQRSSRSSSRRSSGTYSTGARTKLVPVAVQRQIAADRDESLREARLLLVWGRFSRSAGRSIWLIEAYSASSVRKRWISCAAVFSPKPGTPGTYVRRVAHERESRSIICSGSDAEALEHGRAIHGEELARAPFRRQDEDAVAHELIEIIVGW